MPSTVTVTITIDKTAAIKAGSGVWGEQSVIIDLEDLSDAQRAELAAQSVIDGKLDLATIYHDALAQTPYPTLSMATVGGVIDVLDAQIARIGEIAAGEKAAHEKKLQEYRVAIAEWMSSDNPRENSIPLGTGWGKWLSAADQLSALGETYSAEVEAEQVRRQRNTEEIRVANLERQRIAGKEKAAKVAAAAARLDAQIDAWVDANGDSSQQARYARGLLPQGEVQDAIRSAVYAPLDRFARYEKIQDGDVDHSKDCYGIDAVDYDGDSPEINYDAGAAEDVGESAFAVLAHIERELKTAGVVDCTCRIDLHEGECEECEGTVTRYSVMVRITVGEFDFSRRYACSGIGS